MYFTSWSRVPLWLSVLRSSCQICSIYISCPHKTAHIASPPRSASGHAQKTWYILLMGFYLIGEKKNYNINACLECLLLLYMNSRHLHSICSCVTRSLQVSNSGAARILLQSLNHLAKDRQKKKEKEEIQTLRQRER